MPTELSPAAARAAVKSAFPLIRTELGQLIRIPSVSAAGFDPRQVRLSAQATAAWLRRAGFRDARLLEVDGSHPAVYGTLPGPAGSPRLLLYAHHDVQPPGLDHLWESPPFEPTERGGRLFGRGTADDKAGIAVHVAAVQAWAGRPPLDVAVFIEGEEETGSTHLPEFLRVHSELLAADTIVIADCSNWAIGRPTLITSLRGIADCVVEVRTLDHAVHSGKYGGPVPDALTALCRLIATLHDDAGNVTIKGLHTGPPHAVSMDPARLREVVGLRPDVQFLGEGALSQQMWTSPAVAVLGIDAPPAVGAAHKIVPWARASISMRLAPGDDAERALGALEEHLHDHKPWNAEVVVTRDHKGQPHRIDASGPAFDAFRRACTETWGCLPVECGSGGSLPLVAALAETYPDMAMLLTGVDDPESKAHSENESVHLGELQKCCLNEALLLGYLAAEISERTSLSEMVVAGVADRARLRPGGGPGCSRARRDGRCETIAMTTPAYRCPGQGQVRAAEQASAPSGSRPATSPRGSHRCALTSGLAAFSPITLFRIRSARCARSASFRATIR